MTVDEAVRQATNELASAGVETAPVDASWLAAHVLGLRRSELTLVRDQAVDDSQRSALRSLVERRAAREPLAYVLGEWGFRRLTLKLDARALVPRPETEVTVERCLALLDGVLDASVLDVGTGSGAIALAIADEHPGAVVTALERSADALALARENLLSTGLGGRVRLVRGDVRDELPAGPYDLVVANPPYVLDEELPALAPEVSAWEPREAIVDRGQAEAVATAAREVLVPGGFLVLETHGAGARRAAALLRELGYGEITVTRDLSGRERVVEARWQ
jgi:release factor glutamine methyltransferase